jgi:hypothetical protein
MLRRFLLLILILCLADRAAEWLKADAEIPDDPELEVDPKAPQYGYSAKSALQLERKEDMKARGLLCMAPM